MTSFSGGQVRLIEVEGELDAMVEGSCRVSVVRRSLR